MALEERTVSYWKDKYEAAQEVLQYIKHNIDSKCSDAAFVIRTKAAIKEFND